MDCRRMERVKYNRIKELEKEISDLKSKTWCAYCGSEFPLDTVTAEQIGEHINVCKKHPIYKLKQEIAKKDRMVERLIDKLIEDIAECPSAIKCTVNFEGKTDGESNKICRKCWLAWLEKEAEVQP